MDDNAGLEEFLRRALVWPDPKSDLGWVNLHWRPEGKKGITGGQAFKTLGNVMGFIEWVQSKGKGRIADLYYCTSQQKEHGDPKQNGSYSPVRSINNAVASRLLFADVDKYESKDACGGAILKFCEASQSPLPTALVDSGGGLHCYWFLPRPFQKDEWLELAHKLEGLMHQHGLKHDNVSTDMSRLLRPPNTLNFKRNPEGDRVIMLSLNGDINLDTWTSLRDASPLLTPVSAQRAQATKNIVPVGKSRIDPGFVDGSGPDPAFAGIDIPIEERVGKGTLDPAPIFHYCPMFRDTLATGGEQVGQPVWHQQALAATFFVEGRKIFHALGCKHPDYSPESTDEMYDRKLRDRATKDLGYPSCGTFEREGCMQCGTCPMRGKVVSPLNLKREQPDVPFDAGPERPGLWELPPKVDDMSFVWGDPDHDENPKWIYAVEPGGKGKAPSRTLLSRSVIVARPTAFKEETSDKIGVRLFCTNDVNTVVEIIVPGSAFSEPSGHRTYEALNEGGMLVNGTLKINKLLLSIRGKFASENEVMRNVPYGWEFPPRKEGEKQGMPVGFAYDKKVYYPNDKTRDTFGGEPQINAVYCVNGAPNTFQEALRLLLSMKSPGLECVVLSAFAAPLMIFSGYSSTVVMVRGDTGGSKSTASYIGAAVWAQPRKMVMKPASSKLAMMRRMGKVRHMPVIWDDIRTDMFEVVKDTLMEITQGGDGLKLDQNRNEREQGTWDNMLLTSSNDSLVEFLETANKNNGAAMARCFEFTVPKILASDAAYVDPNNLARLVADLEHHHGHAGREYAILLGRSPEELQEMYIEISDSIAKIVAPYQPHERYWMAACATIMMAGKLANTLPILREASLRFDMKAVGDFLGKTFLEQRGRLAGTNVNSDHKGFAKHWLSMFINNWAALHHEIVWTVDKPAGAGKPAGTMPRWPLGDDAKRVRRVTVRWVIYDRKLYISKNALDAYLKMEKISIDRVRDGLLKYYKARLNYKGRMAAGLLQVAAQGQEAVYEIDVYPGTWLNRMWEQHVIPEDWQNIVRLQPEQNPDQSETRPLPEPKDPEDGTGAS